jgi:hypothetical protein
MKQALVILKSIVIFLLVISSHGLASEKKLPVIDGKATVATVNDAPITLEEFNRAIAASHATRPGKKKAGRIDYSSILDRMINTRLIVVEARNMGLDELPEIRTMVDNYAKESLIEFLLEEYVKDIKADEDEVEKVYKEIVKEWKITSVKFEKEDAVKKFEAEMKAGRNFDEEVKKAVEEGVAKSAIEGEHVRNKDLTLPVAQLVSKMEVGSISPIVSVGKKGFVIFRLEGMRVPEEEDPEARERAAREALNQKRIQAARDYYQDLRKKYVTLNEKLLDSLDYESPEPGFEKLLEDDRVIAEIRGEKAVTVGELSKALKQKFYHGVQRSIESKRINKRKTGVLEDMLQRRVLLKEALKQGVDQTDAYKNRVEEYENSVIFGAFIKRVVTPDIRLDEKELKRYYKEHSDEFTYPQMLRIKSLVFGKRSDAVEAIDALTKGTDFGWLSSRAGGQVDKNKEGLFKFEGKLLTLTSLPEDVSKAVSGAKPGDFRLYVSPEGYFYVLYIYHVIPARPQPFEGVKKEIAEEVFGHKVKKAVEIYADKLREYYPVEIYAKDLK